MGEELETKCFQLIAQAGDAKSSFIEAITQASEGHLQEAEERMKSGHKAFVEGHKIHAEMLQHEASGKDKLEGLLVIHAEDQMMSAETFEVMAEQFLNLYRRLQESRGGKEE